VVRELSAITAAFSRASSMGKGIIPEEQVTGYRRLIGVA
jgi:hypothetical protein